LSVLLTTKHNTSIVTALAQALRLDGEHVQRLLARAPNIVVGVLVVLLGARAALLVTGLARAPSPPANDSPAVATVRNEVDIPSILRSNLFGTTVGIDSGNAPVTTVQLMLAGVVADTDPEKGFALLGPAATSIRPYSVGSVVPGGLKLHAVYPDRVLLDRGGTIEALMLPRQPSAAGVAPAPAPTTAPNNALQRVQQVVRDNPGIIGEIIRPQAVLADGRQRGYRVFPGPNAAAFTRLGLRPGDLVTAINGTALDDVSQGGEIFATLGSVAEARVTVTRNGTQQDLILNLAEVAAEAERLNQPGTAPPAPGGPGLGQPAMPAAAR
jgi:general secretion pathway protein C